MASHRPRILFLSSSWPRGDAFGGQLRALHTGRALKQVGDVTLTVVSTSPANDAVALESAEEFDLRPPVVAEPTVESGLGPKLRRALDTRYLNVHGCAASPTDRARVAALAAQHDLVWVLNSRTPNILQQWQWPHSHLDVDDVPSTYLRTVARGGPTLAARWKARVQQRLLLRRERALRQRFTTLSVCSDEDRSYLGGGDQIHVIPNGFERPATVPVPNRAQPPRLGFIGLYSYAPNLDGVRWFLNECWPSIQQAVPGVRFRLIGRETDGPLKPTEPGVDALGWMADPAAEIATWSAMVIPIRFGGGTRIKIVDAFSRKCPVIATSVGAFGYALEDGQQLRLADTPGQFAAACVELLRDPLKATTMADRAWREFLEKWTWDSIAPRIWAAAEDCLRRGDRRINS
jgi:glycosyltransferase involved in cell wall biosynthesis